MVSYLVGNNLIHDMIKNAKVNSNDLKKIEQKTNFLLIIIGFRNYIKLHFIIICKRNKICNYSLLRYIYFKENYFRGN